MTDKAPQAWHHFPHDADIGIQGFGPTPAAAFEEAARALTAAVTDARVEPRIAVSVQCRASNLEGLFVDWLNAVIYEMSARQMLFGDFHIALEGMNLRATLFGEPVDVSRHAPACEPKGATYTALKVAETGRDGWSASCIVDV